MIPEVLGVDNDNDNEAGDNGSSDGGRGNGDATSEPEVLGSSDGADEGTARTLGVAADRSGVSTDTVATLPETGADAALVGLLASGLVSSGAGLTLLRRGRRTS